MTTESKTVRACPNCDDTHINRRVGDTRDPKRRESQTAYYCWNCKENFDEPAERPPRDSGPRNRLKGDSKALFDADPKDYPK